MCPGSYKLFFFCIISIFCVYFFFWGVVGGFPLILSISAQTLVTLKATRSPFFEAAPIHFTLRIAKKKAATAIFFSFFLNSFLYRFFTHPTGPNRAHLDPPGVNYAQLYPIIPKYSPILPNYAQLQPNYTQLHPITTNYTQSHH